MSEVHIHLDDAPDSLAILQALLGDRLGAALIGYVPDDTGAMVDWDLLGNTWLSSSERAAVFIARGCALVEAEGCGLPDEVVGDVWHAIEGITNGRRQ